MAEQVIIEFISDTSQLAPAVDQLEKMEQVEKSSAAQFKATNAELQKQVKTLDQLAATSSKVGQAGIPLKKSILDLNNQVKGLSQTFIKDFQQGAKDALHAAGVSAAEFEDALSKATGETTTLKAQLREMVAALAQMKVSGQDNTAQYRDLAQQAGKLKDAIADANQEVKNFGSDTSTLDGVISLAGGIAGGFAAVQGAAALFGDESEELQKTLLRVNAAMAILQGLQQIQVVLQKESAAATLANTIATRAQTIATAAFNFVVGTSTGLLKVFRIALAATGIGLLIIGVLALVDALKSENNELEEANTLLDEQKRRIEGLNEVIDQRVALQQAQAKKAGAAESELIRIQGRGLQAQREGLEESNRLLFKQLAAVESGSEAWFKLNEQVEANNNAIRGLDNDLAIKALDLEKQLADERAEALKKRIEAAKKEAEEAKKLAAERRAAEFEDFKAGIQVKLLAAKEGSEEELDLRKQLLRATLQIELDNDKLTLNQRRLLIQQFFKDRIDAEKKFAADREKVILENIASDIQAELQTLELSNERKLELTETAINLAAELEINAANQNAAKITEINAKRDKAIRDARIASIQETANYELALAAAANGPNQRRLQQVAADSEAEVRERISAIDQLVDTEKRGILRRLQALNDEKEQKLISQKDYNLSFAQLFDEQLRIVEEGEKRKTEIVKSESEKRREQTIQDIGLVVESASQVVGVLDSLYQLQSAKENNQLSEQKEKLKELQEAGAITEKEAIARQKRLEAEERKIRRKQAEREKQIAVFNAFLAVPQATLKGLTTGGPLLAALYGSLALIQAIAVASRPLPKFGKGKKSSYEGLAQVGETGTELIESRGRMYVADKPQIVWLGKKDKVYNPQETIDMLSKQPISTERVVIPAAKNNGYKIDYDKFGKAVAKHVSTNVYVDGVHEQQIRQKEFTNYLTKRRSF